jgi:hypothetical protein
MARQNRGVGGRVRTLRMFPIPTWRPSLGKLAGLSVATRARALGVFARKGGLYR